MHIVTADTETFWSTEHSLTKMNPIDYVMHPETELISVSIKVDDGPVMCAFGERNIRDLVNSVNWDDAYLLFHNANFDAMIWAWRLGVRPRFWGCTLSMARPLHAKTIGLSLKALVEHYGIGVKDSSALVNTRGKHLADFTTAELQAMAEYNKADTWQCYELFRRLRPHYSAKELWHLDSKIRALVDPQFVLDTELLESALEEERQAKRKSILALAQLLGPQVLAGTGGGPVSEDYVIERVRATLASAPMFSKVLEARGVPTPMKPSPTNPDKLVPALAKTDKAFQELREHPDELVAAAVEARLSVKSTLAETRMQAFLDVAKVTGGRWPVTVNYCGADTTGRASGWHYNPLNLPRVNPDKPKPADALRGSLMAPKGHLVVVADLSGIEMRFNHFLWKVPYSTDLWRKDPEADIYKPTGARLMGVELSEVTEEIRQVGKVVQLGCGFGCGPDKFIDVARIMGGLTLSREESEMYVYGWRDMHPEITQGWRTCHTALSWIFEGIERPIDPHGIFWTCEEGIRLPSGRLIRYPALRNEDGEWVYGTGRHKTRIYAGKVDENCIAEGTLVLTNEGWLPIENIGPTHLVHDGVEFVRHTGLVVKGVQACLEIDGVWMTPDHEVLTYDGWKEASQVQEPYRPDLRGVDGAASVALGRAPVALGVQVPMRGTDHQGGGGRNLRGEARRNPKLWVPDQATHQPKERSTWDEQTPRVCRVPQYARSLSAAIAQSMEELRRAWHYGVRAVARVVRELLGGHGAWVPAWPGPGPQGQRRSVFTGELPVGAAEGQYAEQTQLRPSRGCGRTIQEDRNQSKYSLLSNQARVGGRRLDERAVAYKQVYDITNAGPRHRFVVLGANGPLVVHNCVQAGARDVVYDVAYDVFKETGYRPALEVYDELVYVVPEKDAQALLDTVQARMRKKVEWFPDLVTWSKGDIGTRYSDAK